VKKLFLILFTAIAIGAFSQSNPVAVDDTVQVMNQKLIEIYPLLNDYDPDGDTIEISKVYSHYLADIWYEDSSVFFISEWHEGWVKTGYKVAKIDDLTYESEVGFLNIEVLHNPDVPAAVPDTFNAKYLEPTPIYVMQNDYDLNGDEIKINNISSSNDCKVMLSTDSTYITITSEYSIDNIASFNYEIIERTNKQYVSDRVRVIVYLDENENLPIAVNDTFISTGGIASVFDVLANDHDPLGDSLEYFDVTNPAHGYLSIDNDHINYHPNTSYAGNDEFRYSIRYKNQQGLYSESAKVKIYVNKNPDCPIGGPDHSGGMAYTKVSVDVLSNDYDPLDDEFEIKDVKTRFGQSVFISYSGDSITYTPIVYYSRIDTVYYRIKKTNDPSFYSDWTPVYFEVVDNPAYIVARPDSASTIAGRGITIDFGSNDQIPDSAQIVTISFGSYLGHIDGRTDITVDYVPYWTSSGIDTLFYTYRYYLNGPYLLIGQGVIYVDVLCNRSYDSLFINNINAGVNSNLTLFSKQKETDNYHSGKFYPHFNVPKDSRMNTILFNTVWIGGISENENLHVAGERFYGKDFQAGPITSHYDSLFLLNWQRTWKIRKEEITSHIHNWWKDDYVPVEAIANWPGNGDPVYDLPYQMAPYHDRDQDGIYNPQQGDYPLIRGDECIFFMANDNRKHTETQGDSLQAEFHCMVYAYDAPGDSILNNTIFVHYDLINRSEHTYYDTYFGVFTDFEIGYDWDDYVGSCVMGNSFIGYNGREYDGSPAHPNPTEYGKYPPAQSVTFLAGPYLDEDYIDNPKGGCDYSITGLNFDNGIVDDERIGLSYFIYFNSSGGPMQDPGYYTEYYQYLHGHWQHDVHMLFGGNGLGPSVGPECRYLWPGDTDPLNWGTDCILPNGGYNINGKWWTEEGERNNPDDRRGLGSTGPFTFYPGDVQEVDMAYVFANSYHSADSSKNLLIERLYELRQRTLDGEIVIPNSELSVNEVINKKPSFNIYPNPAGDLLNINYSGIDDVTFSIVNTMGTMVLSGRIEKGSGNSINVKSLNPGVYIISITSEKTVSSKKFVKY